MRFIASLAVGAALACLQPLCSAQTAGTITTIAGTGSAGYSGDGGPATSAVLNAPIFLATDPAGNIYIADQNNNVIRKMTPAGIISTFAGTGSQGFSGDGGLANQAQLNNPIGVFVESNGVILIADVGNSRIRAVSTAGVITTVAGNGGVGYGGDGGPATSATFHNCVRAVADPAGNIYIADQSNHRVRKVGTDGIINTIAGTGVEGFSGDNGPATGAELDNPTALALDSANNLFISDQFNQRVREVNGSGIITTVAGNGTKGFAGDGGLATAAELNYPGGLAIDGAGNIFVAEQLNYRVRRFTVGGNITTVVGNGNQGFSGDGGPAVNASINDVFGIALDNSGNFLLADTNNNRIRMVYGASVVTPIVVSAAVTNSASFATGGSPGALATVFGQHLSINVSGIVGATSIPLPPTLAGSSITVNGVTAPVLAVANVNGAEQINFQIPWEAASQLNATVVVNNGSTSSAPVPVQLTAAQPGIFTLDGTNAILEHLDGSLVSSSKPATNGEIIVAFGTGLGPVTPAVATAQAYSSTPVSVNTLQPTITVGGLPATVLFSGGGPGFVGLNQLNIQLPTGLASGPQTLAISSNGVAGNNSKIPIQ